MHSEERELSTVPNDPSNASGMAEGERDTSGQHSAADRNPGAEERLGIAVDRNVERIKAYVKKNPMASAGIAFLAGLVVSSLVRR